MKVSPRALALLAIIDSKTERDASGKLLRYYLPIYGDGVSGSGDARALKSLETKGLIRAEGRTRYSFSITEAGRTALRGARA